MTETWQWSYSQDGVLSRWGSSLLSSSSCWWFQGLCSRILPGFITGRRDAIEEDVWPPALVFQRIKFVFQFLVALSCELFWKMQDNPQIFTKFANPQNDQQNLPWQYLKINAAAMIIKAIIRQNLPDYAETQKLLHAASVRSTDSRERERDYSPSKPLSSTNAFRKWPSHVTTTSELMLLW